MADTVLTNLLAGNAEHVTSLPAGYFEDVQDEQHPEIVTVCCSDSRVSQEGMWGVDRPGAVFTPSNIGNQAWDIHEGEQVVDGSILYPIVHTGTDRIGVVGHTGCGAVTAAYNVVTGDDPPAVTGIRKWVDSLVPVVENGFESEVVDTDDPTVIDQLVEYNVNRQVAFLREAADVPADVRIYGFVYDLHRVYGDEAGRAYLVNLDGVTGPDAIAADLPEEFEIAARSLLY